MQDDVFRVFLSISWSMSSDASVRQSLTYVADLRDKSDQSAPANRAIDADDHRCGIRLADVTA